MRQLLPFDLKIKIVALLCPLMATITGNAQNIVPNGNFETFSPCPTQFGQITAATNWILPTTGTTDYYNSCSTNPGIGVPTNNFGVQVPFSGQAYAGLVLWYEPTGLPEFREYMEVQLTDPLSAGACYQVAFQISLAEEAQYDTDSIGVYFSAAQIGPTGNWNPLPFVPQVTISLDTVTNLTSWYLLSQTFTATGNEAYMTIGNFDDIINASGQFVNASAGNQYSYYYIDDVSITPCTGLSEGEQQAAISIYPSVFSDQLQVSYSGNEPVQLRLFDLSLKLIVQQEIHRSATLSCENISQGMYIYEFRSERGVLQTGKLIKP